MVCIVAPFRLKEMLNVEICWGTSLDMPNPEKGCTRITWDTFKPRQVLILWRQNGGATPASGGAQNREKAQWGNFVWGVLHSGFFVAAKWQSLNRQCDGCLESSGDIQYIIVILGKIYEHLVWGKARLCFYSMLLNWQLHATVFPKYIDGGHECGPSLSSWGVNVL